MSNFIAKPGQVDYTNVRYAPVINIVLAYGREILLVQRSQVLRTYPGYWSGISGYLDDQQSLKEKVYSELLEEANIPTAAVGEVILANIFHQEALEYHKTWIVHAILARLNDARTKSQIELDWEAEQYAWVDIDAVSEWNVLPGFIDVLAAVRPYIQQGK